MPFPQNPTPQIKRPGKRERPDGRPLRLITIQQLADDVQMSDRWIREQVRNGIPHFKFGTSVRFDPFDARQWLRERYVKQNVRRTAPQ